MGDVSRSLKSRFIYQLPAVRLTDEQDGRLRGFCGHTIQMFLSALKPSDVICTILAVQRKFIIYVSRVKLVHLPDINILKSTELSRITYDPDMLEATRYLNYGSIPKSVFMLETLGVFISLVVEY
ncbi:hypothetical protein HanHA300_Chr00c0045g0697071 [Helianthus annuus]|nr:uncharacterized protein LOC110910729 isoform X3 [Helianthus annuus]KAJ0638781.1 hypothetical protein HanHA300_Chr00c0045g0697071 [Helianthus annuus]